MPVYQATSVYTTFFAIVAACQGTRAWDEAAEVTGRLRLKDRDR
jgi:hypothetical protein